jgi:hypothetical protein
MRDSYRQHYKICGGQCRPFHQSSWNRSLSEINKARLWYEKSPSLGSKYRYLRKYRFSENFFATIFSWYCQSTQHAEHSLYSDAHLIWRRSVFWRHSRSQVTGYHYVHTENNNLKKNLFVQRQPVTVRKKHNKRHVTLWNIFQTA